MFSNNNINNTYICIYIYMYMICIHISKTIEKLGKTNIEKLKIFGDGPGCFGGSWGVIPEYFHGISEGF